MQHIGNNSVQSRNNNLLPINKIFSRCCDAQFHRDVITIDKFLSSVLPETLVIGVIYHVLETLKCNCNALARELALSGKSEA